MGFLQNLKDKLAPAKDKVAGLAQQHGDKIDQGLDKAAKVVDDKTKGKYSDKIQTGTGKAKDAVDRLAGTPDEGRAAGGGTTPATGGTAPATDGPTTPTGGTTPPTGGITPPPGGTTPPTPPPAP